MLPVETGTPPEFWLSIFNCPVNIPTDNFVLQDLPFVIKLLSFCKLHYAAADRYISTLPTAIKEHAIPVVQAHNDVHRSILHYNQKPETQMPIKRRTAKKTAVYSIHRMKHSHEKNKKYKLLQNLTTRMNF